MSGDQGPDRRSAARVMACPASARLAQDQETVFKRMAGLVDLSGTSVVEIGGCLPADLVASSGVRRWWSCDPRFRARTSDPVEALGIAAEEIPLPSGTIDVAFSCNALQHVSAPPKVFAEVARLLRPEGIFYANFGPVWSAPDGAHVEGLEFGGKVLDFWEYCLLPSWAHLVCDSVAELRNMLAPIHGADLAASLADYVFKSRWINRTPADGFRRLAEGADFEVLFFGGNPQFGYEYDPPRAHGRLATRCAPGAILTEARRRNPEIVDDLATRDIEFLLRKRQLSCTC